MDNYMEDLIKREDEKLSKFLSASLDAINLGFKDELVSIKRTSYEQYEDVLEIVHTSGNVAYININANSIKATARVLFEYILTGDACGLIVSGFKDENE